MRWRLLPAFPGKPFHQTKCTPETHSTNDERCSGCGKSNNRMGSDLTRLTSGSASVAKQAQPVGSELSDLSEHGNTERLLQEDQQRCAFVHYPSQGEGKSRTVLSLTNRKG